jgi:hypothetical protein
VIPEKKDHITINMSKKGGRNQIPGLQIPTKGILGESVPSFNVDMGLQWKNVLEITKELGEKKKGWNPEKSKVALGMFGPFAMITLLVKEDEQLRLVLKNCASHPKQSSKEGLNARGVELLEGITTKVMVEDVINDCEVSKETTWKDSGDLLTMATMVFKEPASWSSVSAHFCLTNFLFS